MLNILYYFISLMDIYCKIDEHKMFQDLLKFFLVKMFILKMRSIILVINTKSNYFNIKNH